MHRQSLSFTSHPSSEHFENFYIIQFISHIFRIFEWDWKNSYVMLKAKHFQDLIWVITLNWLVVQLSISSWGCWRNRQVLEHQWWRYSRSRQRSWLDPKRFRLRTLLFFQDSHRVGIWNRRSEWTIAQVQWSGRQLSTVLGHRNAIWFCSMSLHLHFFP